MVRGTWGSFRCSNSFYIDVVQIFVLPTALYEDQRFLEPSETADQKNPSVGHTFLGALGLSGLGLLAFTT